MELTKENVRVQMRNANEVVQRLGISKSRPPVAVKGYVYLVDRGVLEQVNL